MGEVKEEYVHPFIRFCEEDKSHYPTAQSKGYIDHENDFLVGESGGFLCNISFKFINTYLFKEVGNFFEENGYYTDANLCPVPSGTFAGQQEQDQINIGTDSS